MYSLLRPLLFQLDAETAHGLTLRLLELGRAARLLPAPPEAGAPVEVAGLQFANPVGLAAGLDKDGAHVDALAALGFGFIEVGTTTPRPQPGNPRPRLFRLPDARAIINRFGFNNRGVDTLVRNVERARWTGVLGINIGKNKDTPNDRAVDDYLHCLERVWPRASYVTVNISSPNTEGLRELQAGESLRALLGALREGQERLAARHGARKPVFLKIAPDLDTPQLDTMAGALLEAGVDGVICSNTTIHRSTVAGLRHGQEAGGLSGAPLFEASTRVVRELATRLGGAVPLIGVGGILSGSDAVAKIEAGASLVQLYSGLVYRGPALVGECIEALRAHA